MTSITGIVSTLTEQLTMSNDEPLHLLSKSAVELNSGQKANSDGYYTKLELSFDRKCLAVLSSQQTIRIFDAKTLVRTASISGHSKPITGIRYSNQTTHILYSSAEDGFVRSWDLRASSTKPQKLYTVSGFKAVPLLSMDVTCNDRFLAAGSPVQSEEACLYFWDIRMPESVGVYSDLHSDDITTLRFHPAHQDLLLTGADDGLVNSLDISQSSEDDALQYTLDAECALDSVGWLSAGSKNIFAITASNYNSIFIWDAVSGDTKCQIPLQDLCNTDKSDSQDYIVACYQSSKNANSVNILTGQHSGQGSVFSYDLTTDSSKAEHICSLNSGHTKTIRGALWNDKAGHLYTIAEDSVICSWSCEEIKQESPQTHSTKSKTETKRPAKPYSRKP